MKYRCYYAPKVPPDAVNVGIGIADEKQLRTCIDNQWDLGTYGINYFDADLPDNLSQEWVLLIMTGLLAQKSRSPATSVIAVYETSTQARRDLASATKSLRHRITEIREVARNAGLSKEEVDASIESAYR
jgi:hypothetical protein